MVSPADIPVAGAGVFGSVVRVSRTGVMLRSRAVFWPVSGVWAVSGTRISIFDVLAPVDGLSPGGGVVGAISVCSTGAFAVSGSRIVLSVCVTGVAGELCAIWMSLSGAVVSVVFAFDFGVVSGSCVAAGDTAIAPGAGFCGADASLQADKVSAAT